MNANAREFLQSKRAKSLPGKDYTSAKNDELEVEKSHAGRGATRIVPWPLGITAIYWYFQAKRGNKDAETLVISCLYDSLLRRADEVFDVTRTQDEYHAANVELMQALGRVARERDILLENYDIDDDARQLADAAWSEVTRLETENERLREQLRYYQ
ncbi:MAG: hypothetical protein HC795_14615 [Coleofasciculaceae cyanobacterium RL_1_1]|nr:hypothetical protein [Coleofasciculaceae cyanobacterium RL_1_1]